jgi:dTMP kinase
MTGRGRFITFEGGEGSGKSTQIGILSKIFATRGIQGVVTREPGGSPGAEIMRHLVLSGFGKLLGGNAEAMLFAAAREDHVRTVIEPALQAGRWVLCDRFTDSTRVYQGRLGNVDLKLIRSLEHVTIGDLQPDLTIVLDVPAEIGMARAARRRGSAQPDRFEAESEVFHRRLRDAYKQVVADEPDRCVLISANDDIETVAQNVLNAVLDRIPELRAWRVPEPSEA